VDSLAQAPFRKRFDELEIGETIITHRRTVTEADIVNFGCISGDHFYAHFDEIAAKDSLFGKRVAHGYFVISAAAGMFVDPAPGPVLANYGLENLRFIEPVGIGDTIQVRLTAKEKIWKAKRPEEDKATGVVVWDVEVKNQDDVSVAIYDPTPSTKIYETERGYGGCTPRDRVPPGAGPERTWMYLQRVSGGTPPMSPRTG